MNDKHCSGESKLVEIYTDGACSGNPGPGGWGVYLKYRNTYKKLSGSEPETTNNRMELMAAIEALRALKYCCKVKLYTDSNYLKNGINEWIYKWKANNWLKNKKEPVKNADLWKLLDELRHKHEIEWIWVKGHSDNEGNDIADKLATEAAKTQAK
jgi:ribonuclease HI